MKNRVTNLSRLVAIIFFIFLFFPILNPRIAGTSVYFFYFIPLVDVNFLRFIKLDLQKLTIIIIGFIIAVIVLDLFLIIKIFFLSFTLIYFRYLQFTRLDILVLYFFIIAASIGFVQMFSLLIFDTMWLNPEVISKTLYADYAIQLGEYRSKVNYLGMGYRVSGWSTEPAFYSSLIFMAYIYCRKILRTRSFVINAIFILACFISFSRITALLLLIIMIFSVIDYLKIRLNLFVVAIAYPIVLAIFFNYIYSIFSPALLGGSGVHRTLGYYVLSRLSDIEFRDIIFGLGNYGIYDYSEKISALQFSPMYLERKGNILDNSGISEVILQYGLFGYTVLVLLLYKLKITGNKLLFLFLSTINVSVVTSSSFVLIAWALTLGRYNNNENISRTKKININNFYT